MIAVDTSALLAVLIGEPAADAYRATLAEETDVLVSAGTFTEALIVAQQRGVAAELRGLVEQMGITVVPLTADSAQVAALAHARWGKGVHPAGLNFGDCFAYALAIERDIPLLFVGSDFSRTDVKAALPRAG